jgi:uncharacterized protein YqhQ
MNQYRPYQQLNLILFVSVIIQTLVQEVEISTNIFFAILFCFQILGLLFSVRKITLKVRNSQVKLRKLAFFLKKIKTEYP